MYSERAGGSSIDYPLGGSRVLVDALVRAIEKFGGRVERRARVARFLPTHDGTGVAGVILAGRPGERVGTVVARRGVVSNASAWDTQDLLRASSLAGPGGERVLAPPQAAWAAERSATPMTGSFLHLHAGLRNDDGALDHLIRSKSIHALCVESWDRPLDDDRNVVNVSIPTALDPSAAPPGRFAAHVYTAANESFTNWEGLEEGTPAYEALKTERCGPLWRALAFATGLDEANVRSRAEVALVASPLTHRRFLNRSRGTYGPAISAARGNGAWPGPKTPVKGLWQCGDSCQPGIGVPAAAGSGLMLANTAVGLGTHLVWLDELERLRAM